MSKSLEIIAMDILHITLRIIANVVKIFGLLQDLHALTVNLINFWRFPACRFTHRFFSYLLRRFSFLSFFSISTNWFIILSSLQRSCVLRLSIRLLFHYDLISCFERFSFRSGLYFFCFFLFLQLLVCKTFLLYSGTYYYLCIV